MLSCFAAEKTALEKRVKELEETLATRNAEAEKVAKDATTREEEFVNRVAFLTQDVQGKYLRPCTLWSFRFVTCFAHFPLCFYAMQRRLVF